MTEREDGWEEKTIQSWEEFVTEIDPVHDTARGEEGYIFRGHADAGWRLSPTLARQIEGRLGRDEACELEDTLLKEFRSRAHLYEEIPFALLDAHRQLIKLCWLPYIQHYGGPTRLLDWTRSPFISVYFAVESRATADGALWYLHRGRLEASELHVEAIDANIGPGPGDRETKIGFAPVLYSTERMIAQQGTLMFCTDIFADIAGMAELELTKLIIPARLKGAFLTRLHSMGITASSLFPGIDGLGRSLGEMAEIRAHGKVVFSPPPTTADMTVPESRIIGGGMAASPDSPDEPRTP